MSYVEIKISCKTPIARSGYEKTIRIDKDTWDAASDEERERMCMGEVLELIEWDFHVINENENEPAYYQCFDPD